jgi:hypothetical protein
MADALIKLDWVRHSFYVLVEHLIKLSHICFEEDLFARAKQISANKFLEVKVLFGVCVAEF